MSGETDLDALIAAMEPVLAPETFVFATIPAGEPMPDVATIMRFTEAEGETLILRADVAAKAGIAGEFPCRMITLNIHSALEAVGFLARIIPGLAAEGMGVNPVAGFYHDHLFVPADRADDAMAALKALSSRG